VVVAKVDGVAASRNFLLKDFPFRPSVVWIFDTSGVVLCSKPRLIYSSHDDTKSSI